MKFTLLMETEQSAPPDDRIKNMYAENVLPAALEDKVVARLKQEGQIRNITHWHLPIKIAALVIFGFTLFFSGYWLATSLNVSVAQNPTQKFLLLLYEPSTFIAGDGHFKEYGQWLSTINNKGAKADGEALENGGWVMNNQGMQSLASSELNGQNGSVGGFFMIEAANENQAREIAATCPHLKYNGIIEVRPILKSSNR